MAETKRKKFCTNCGKELKNGETCDCQVNQSAVNVNTDAIVASGKGILNDIINMFKKPATTLKDKLKANDGKTAFIMLIIIAISFGLYLLMGFKSIINVTSGASGFDIDKAVSIPYFKIFLYATLIKFILAFVPILVTLISAKIGKTNDFDFKKSVGLYAYSMAPTIFTNIGMGILGILNISFLTIIGSIVGGFISLVCIVNYIKGFADHTNYSEDSKAYAITGTSIAIVIVYSIVIVIFGISLFTSIISDIGVNSRSRYSRYDISDIFDF